MKRTGLLVTVLAALCLLSGCQFRISKPLLKMMVSSISKEQKFTCYADSCDSRIGIPYVENGTPAQVMDIYYAPANIRKNAVLVDIHGGFYIGGNRKNNRPFASVFLKEGYDVVLVEYRLNDGKLDVLAFRKMPLLEFGPLLMEVISGRHPNTKHVIYFQTPSLTIESEEDIPTDIDGEHGEKLPLKFGVLKKRLDIFVDEKTWNYD